MADAEDFAAQTVGLHARLTRVVLGVCGDLVLAEDSAQEALVRAWERVDQGDALRSLDALTIRVALNWCRSQLRHTGAEDRAVKRLEQAVPRSAGSDTTEGGLRAGTLAADVHHAVLALPERQTPGQLAPTGAPNPSSTRSSGLSPTIPSGTETQTGETTTGEPDSQPVTTRLQLTPVG